VTVKGLRVVADRRVRACPHPPATRATLSRKNVAQGKLNPLRVFKTIAYSQSCAHSTPPL